MQVTTSSILLPLGRGGYTCHRRLARTVVYQGKIAMQKDPGTGNVIPVTVRKIDNRLLQFILERRHPDYRERVDESGIVDIHRMMENLNLGRQRVAEEQAEREAQDTPDSTLPDVPPV
jgi:hypothetical protein